MSEISFKVVCFGDSTTDATFAPSDPNFMPNYKGLKVYSKWLEEKLPDLILKNIEVINAGVSGDTTKDAKQRFQQDVIDHHPDLVVIQFGVNDQSVRQDLNIEVPIVSVEAYAYNLLFFISRIRKIKAAIILMTPGILMWNDNFKQKYFKKPYDLNAKFGLNGHLIKYVEMMRKIAQIENIPLVDVFQAELDHEEKNRQTVSALLPDGLHPNNKGHEFIADLLINHLIRSWVQ